jgi:hypothetical protein
MEMGPTRANITLPLEPPPVRPTPAVTPVKVLEPLSVFGKAWPGAKVITPVGAIERPVATGADVPAPKNNFMLAEGLDVLLPELIACQMKF